MTGQIPKRPFSALRLQRINNNSPVNSTSDVHQTSTTSGGTAPVGSSQKRGCFNFPGILFIALCLFTVGCIGAIFKDGWPPNTNGVIFPVVGILIGILGCLFAGIQILQGQQLNTFFQEFGAFFQRNFNVIALVTIALLIICLILAIIRPVFGSSSQTPPPSSINCGACNAFSAPNSEFIGISDGRYIFDTQRVDNIFKQKQDWYHAIAIDENDAEALIYQENQVITNQPHLTLVVVTALTLHKGSHNKASLDLGRTLLQGAFVAQREANSSLWLPGGRKVRLLIANAGDTSTQADLIAKQILQEAKTDPNFAGVMGWPFSTPEALAAIQKLANQHIPMISPTASTDLLNGTTSAPYFLRIAPTDSDQAEIGVRFAKNVLNPNQIALFTDEHIPYSQTLSQQFKTFWGFDPSISSYSYTRGDPASLRTALQLAMQHPPDLIYFAGYSDDLQVLLQNPLLQSRLITGKPFVMGGDGIATLGGYNGTYQGLYFTEFAYPDEWDILGLQNKPTFFANFRTDFDSHNLHLPPYHCDYNYCRPQGTAMLAYDAMQALLMGCKIVLKQQPSWDLSKLQPALMQIDGSTPDRTLQGITGQIRFTSEGNVADKTIVVLCVTKGKTSGFTKLVGIYNTFQADGQRLSRIYPGQPDQLIKQCST